MTENKNTRILVLGAGYAGVMAAVRLAGKTKKLPVDVTLVNGVDTFIQRPRLHQVASNQPVPEKPIAEMLQGTRVKFEQGWVTAIEPDKKRVKVETGFGPEEILYDYLVYALGSKVDTEGVQGIAEHAFVLDPRGRHTTSDLRKSLLALQAGGRVVVVGGGATGIEGATEIQGLYPTLQVSLVTRDAFGAFKGERVQKHLRQAFQEQGIQVDEHSPVKAVEEGRLILDDGRVMPFEVLVWAGGFRALPLARQAGLLVNGRDQILADPFLRSLSHPDIYAVGDAGQPVEEPGNIVRMSLLVAVTSAAHAADNLVSLIKGKDQKPFSFAYYGQGIALGPNDAVGFAGFPNDMPIGPILRGRVAVWIRAFFVWLLLYMLEVERRLPGFYFWLGRGRYAAQQRAAAKSRQASEAIT